MSEREPFGEMYVVPCTNCGNDAVAQDYARPRASPTPALRSAYCAVCRSGWCDGLTRDLAASLASAGAVPPNPPGAPASTD